MAERILSVVVKRGRAAWGLEVAKGGVALAEALHGVVRPELVGAATMAASFAMAGKYRDAVHIIKTAVERVKVTVEKAVEGVKIAVERLYEAVAEAAARIVQMLKEHWRAVALIAAAAAAGLITWFVAQQIDHALFVEHAASLASLGFFGVGRIAEDKQRQLWKKMLNDWSLSAAGEKVETIRALLSERPIFAERFEGAEESAAREARLRAWLVKKALELRWEPAAEKAVATLVEEAVGPYLDKEKLKAFGVAQGVEGFLYKLHGEKESALRVGNVEAKELYAIVAKTGEKTIHVEVYAKSVSGGQFEAVDTPIGRLYRVASLSVSTADGKPGTPKLNFTASVEREYRVGVELADKEHRKYGLYGLMKTDLGQRGLGSPDLSEHAFLGLFAQIKKMYVEGANLTDTGLSLQIVSEIEERFPPKVFFWEAMRGAVEKALEKALGSQRPEDLNKMLEALCGGPCVSAEPLLKVFREHFAELKELTATARRKEWRFYVKDDINEVRINKEKGVAYVPRRVLFELLEAMKWPEFWVALLEGDGVPKVYERYLGLAVKKEYKAAAAVLMAALALRYGIQPRLIEGKGERAVSLDATTSRVVSLLLMHELRQSPVVVLEEDEAAKRSEQWGLAGALALIVRRLVEAGMPGGRDPPKLISLFAFYEGSLMDLYSQYQGYLEGKAERPPYLHLIEKILREEGEAPFYVREGILPTTAFDIRMKYLDKEFRLDMEEAWRRYRPAMSLVDRSYVLSAEYGEKKGSAVIMVPVDTADGVRWQRVKVWTDWRNYQVFCSGQHCDEARKALGAEEREGGYYIKSVLGKAIIYTALRRLENSLEIGEWSEDVKRQMEKREEGVKKWMKAPARVELLEVRDNGDVRFKIWFYRWLDTRPQQPFVDVEVRYDEAYGGFRGWLYVNEAEGIYSDHLKELYEMFESINLSTTPKFEGNVIKGLDFTGGFRKELLRRVGYRPEPVAAAEPAAVKHLGGLRFEVGGRVVEFEKSESKRVSLVARLRFNNENEAIDFSRRLRAAGIYADVKGKVVRLDDESFWGVAVASGATPEGFQRIYPLDEDVFRDLYVFRRVVRRGGEVHVYYQFVVRHGGLWRAAGGWFDGKRVELQHTEYEVLEAVKEAVNKALETLGEETRLTSTISRDARWEVHRLPVTRPVLAAFDKRFDKRVAQIEASSVALHGSSLAVKVGGSTRWVEFRPLKTTEAVSVGDPDGVLYAALITRGIRAEPWPGEVRLRRDGMWGLLAEALEEAAGRGEQPALPPNVKILRRQHGHYIFAVDADGGRYIYSVLRVKGEWTAMGGKVRRSGTVLMQHSEMDVAVAHAEAIGRVTQRKIDVRKDADGYPYFLLNEKWLTT